MTTGITGTWYRRGYIVPIPDELNDQPEVIVGYFVRGVWTTSSRFLPPRWLFPSAPENTSRPPVERCWFLTEQDAQDAIDLYMQLNGYPDL